MALREKFGRLVLLDETDTSPLGNEYRAARLGASGFDRLVTVLRFSERISAHADATRRLVEQARIAAQVHSPGLVKMLGVGRVGAVHYLSTELVEGRSVSAVLLACRENGFPFGADHSLMIASRAAAGLEALAGRKGDDGQPLFHGLVAPRQLAVAFDGDVKVKGLGLWPALGQTDLLAPEERAYLAPEQAAGQGDARSDVYSLGLVLLEMVSGTAPHGGDAQTLVAGARIAAPGGEPGPLPKPLADLLRRALAADPAARFKGVSELRRGIDALLFSGDFTPTTFDLAFFMHTLFRDEVERDARAAEAASRADYREFLAEEGAKTAPASPAPGAPGAEVDTAAAPGEPPAAATEVPAATLSAEPAGRPAPTAPPPRTVPASGPDASSPRIARAAREPVSREAAARDAAARDAAGRLSLGGGAAASRRGLGRSAWLGIGVIAAAILGGGAGWLYFVSRQSAPPSAAPSAEQAAAEARVRELEARIAELETEKAAAETRAAEDARATVEKQAAAGGQAADPAAIQRAQDEARLRARQEQERRQQEELQRLADEKRAEEQRLAAAAAAALAAAPSPVPLATPPPPTPAASAPASADAVPVPGSAPSPTPAGSAAQPAPGPSTAPQGPVTPASPGVPVPASAPAPGRIAPADPADPAVRPPSLVSEDPVPYPRRASAARITTVVVVVIRALVDETGRVTEASITQASGQPPEFGFDEAALKRVRSRKYRPARRHDVPVPIWLVIRLEFRPPPVQR